MQKPPPKRTDPYLPQKRRNIYRAKLVNHVRTLGQPYFDTFHKFPTLDAPEDTCLVEKKKPSSQFQLTYIRTQERNVLAPDSLPRQGCSHFIAAQENAHLFDTG